MRKANFANKEIKINVEYLRILCFSDDSLLLLLKELTVFPKIYQKRVKLWFKIEYDQEEMFNNFMERISGSIARTKIGICCGGCNIWENNTTWEFFVKF